MIRRRGFFCERRHLEAGDAESDLLAFHIAISIAIAVQWALVQIAHLVD
jgi:hypothetical protein